MKSKYDDSFDITRLVGNCCFLTGRVLQSSWFQLFGTRNYLVVVESTVPLWCKFVNMMFVSHKFTTFLSYLKSLSSIQFSLIKMVFSVLVIKLLIQYHVFCTDLFIDIPCLKYLHFRNVNLNTNQLLYSKMNPKYHIFIRLRNFPNMDIKYLDT